MERWLLQEPLSTIEARRPPRTKSTTKTKRTADIGPTKETMYFYAPFRFFDLPRELRDMVYDEVWSETPCKSMNTLNPSTRIDIHASYRKRDKFSISSTYLSYWSLVNKKFLSEAMAQYFREVDWWARVPSSKFSTPIFLSISLYRPLTSVLMEEDLRVAFANRKIDGDNRSSKHTQKPLKVIDPSPINLSIFKKLQPSLGGLGHQRTLYITFGIVHSRHQEFRGVDLSELDATGLELDELVVEVICTRTKKAELVNRAYGLLNREIRRLGALMIGSPIVVKHTKSANEYAGKGIRRVFEVTKAYGRGEHAKAVI